MRELQVDFESIDYAKTKLDETTVTSLVTKAGGIPAVLNTRHATAKAQGWADKPPTVAAFAKAVVAEPNLLKRPIVVHGDQVIIGFNKTAYGKLPKVR